MKKLLAPIKGLHSMRHNSVVIHTTQGLIQFPHLTMQAKNAAIETSAKPQPVLVQDHTTVPPMTTKTITAFVDYPSEWHTTGTVTPVGKITEAVSLLISYWISTLIDKKTAVSNTNTTESPYFIKKNTNCWILRSHSGTIQVHQTGGHGISQYDSGGWSGSDYFSERFTQKEQTRTTEQQLLVSDTRKSWQYRGSYTNTATNPWKTAWTARKRKTEPKRWRRITNEIVKTIWLDGHTAYRNRKICSRKYPGWVP